ncbi:MAG: response regulator [Elusimicrobia bacterium]|nr:response regulator [Elusimicrobiota bacterium]
MKQTILIADDKPEVRELLSGMLKEHGYNVLLAENGLDAVKLAQKHLPSLILLDIKMPIKDGIEACREIRQEDKTKMIPIIILSVAGQSAEIQKAMLYGANSYITKPCNKEKILDIVQAELNPPSQANWLNIKRPK